MIRVDAVWLAVEPLDMRAGTDTALGRIVKVFGAAHPHHAYLFVNRRANRLKVLVHADAQRSPRWRTAPTSVAACTISCLTHASRASSPDASPRRCRTTHRSFGRYKPRSARMRRRVGPLEKAIAYVNEATGHTEFPSRYRCGERQQLLRRSGAFDMEERALPERSGLYIFYRTKSMPSISAR